MKRILIFSLTYHPFVGGAEVAIKEITDRIDPGAYAFDMVTLRFDSALPAVEKIGNIMVYRIGPTVGGARVSDRNLPLVLRFAKAAFPFWSLVKAMMLHRVNRYDMIWAMMANPAGFGALFFKFLHPHVPYFLELQDGRAFADMPERRPILRVIWALYVRVYLMADLIKTISRFIEKEVRGVGYEKEVAVIPNGVDVERFSKDIPEDELVELKAKLGKKMGDIFLFTASRLVLSRGVEETIAALSYLPSHVRLLIAGAGDDRAKLETIAREKGVMERILWLGHVDHSELPKYYKVSDIFVRPSIIEGFGNSFVEAFAAGIPVVATPVGGIPDFLFDPERDPDMEPTGVFCAVRDAESVAKAVTRYIDDPAQTARIVKNAKELAALKYDWRIIAQSMETRVFWTLTKSG